MAYRFSMMVVSSFLQEKLGAQRCEFDFIANDLVRDGPHVV